MQTRLLGTPAVAAAAEEMAAVAVIAALSTVDTGAEHDVRAEAMESMANGEASALS